MIIFSTVLLSKVGSSCLPLWNHSKEAKLEEKNVCFILEASNVMRGQGRLLSKGQLSHPHPRLPHGQSCPQKVGKSFYGWKEGVAYNQLWHLSWNWSQCGLLSINFIAVSAVSLHSRVCWFPFRWGQFLELWQTAHVMAIVWSSCS